MSAGKSNDVRIPGEVPSGTVARPALVAALKERVVTPPLRSAPDGIQNTELQVILACAPHCLCPCDD